MNKHFVFHLSLIDPVATDLVIDEILQLLPKVEMDDKKELKAAAILKSLKGSVCVEYYIQWIGMDHNP